MSCFILACCPYIYHAQRSIGVMRHEIVDVNLWNLCEFIACFLPVSDIRIVAYNAIESDANEFAHHIVEVFLVRDQREWFIVVQHPASPR